MKTRKVRSAVTGLGLAFFSFYQGAIVFSQQAPLAHASATSSVPAHDNSGYTVEQNVMVTMKDGTRIATDIYRPAKGSLLLPAQFWVSSSAPDTDFVAKLSDAYPDGYSMILAVGQIRNGVDHLSSIKPATIYQVSVDLGPTSNLFVPGHRIRLDISSTDFPRLEPNPNSGVRPGQWSNAIKARNTIYYGGSYPSSLILPVKSSSPQPQ
jgi:uncharacterized protein